MFITYKNLSVNPSNVLALEVENKVLHILCTAGNTYEITFNSEDEATAGLTELTKLLNAHTNPPKSTPDASGDVFGSVLTDTITSCMERLQGSFGGLKSKDVKNKSVDLFSDIMGKKEELVARVVDMVESLDKVLSTNAEKSKESKTTEDKKSSTPERTKETVKRAANIIDTDGIFTSSDPNDGSTNTKKMNAEEFKSVFGTENEPLIGDLSERQLKEFISDFVDDTLNNERVQSLFQTVRDNFGDSDADKAIDGYKNLILSLCLTNTEMTLSEVLAQFFG